MKSGTMFSLLSMAMVIVCMSGCSTTLVESLPVGKSTTCDAAWPGRWKQVALYNEKPEANTWMEINSDCTELTFIDPDKTEREKHTITLISTRVGDFITISDPAGKRDCLGPDSNHCGVELRRYVRSGDEIRLYEADHKKIHAAIASHVISGYTEAHADHKATPEKEATTNNESSVQANSSATGSASTSGPQENAGDTEHYNNQIAGTPEQITSILEQHPDFFETTPWMTLQRDDPPAPSKHP